MPFRRSDLAAASAAVAEWSQTVLGAENASELMALALKHAIVQRDVAHLIFPDEVQEPPRPRKPSGKALAGPPRSTGDLSTRSRDSTRRSSCWRTQERPVIIMGNGARQYRDQVVALAEKLDAPVITTFRGKRTDRGRPSARLWRRRKVGDPGRFSDDDQGGRPAGGRGFVLEPFGIATWVPTIQIDFDRMTLGKFHPG